MRLVRLILHSFATRSHSQIWSCYRHISSRVSSVPDPDYANTHGSCQAESPIARGREQRLQLHIQTERHHTTAEGQEKSCHPIRRAERGHVPCWACRTKQLRQPKSTSLSLTTHTCSASSSSHARHGCSLTPSHPPFLVCVSLYYKLPVVSNSVGMGSKP